MAEQFILGMHRSKDSNWDAWEHELNGDPDSDAAREFAYTGYEVIFHTMVDMETGECMAYGIDANDGKGLVEFSRPFRI